MIKNVLLLIVAIFIATNSFCQLPVQNRIFHYTTKDGLSFGVVNSIAQDKRGFIWIGTADGLNRFDGSDFKVFKLEPDNKYSLPSNFVDIIFKDSDGDLWVSSRTGLNKFDPEKERFITYKFHKEAPGAQMNSVGHISESRDKNLWVAFSNGGFSYFNKKKKTIINYNTDNLPSLHNNSVGKILEDSNNLLWVGTLTGINVYHIGKNKKLEKAPVDTRSLPLYRVHCIYNDRFNNIWIATHQGLIFYKRNLNKFFILHGPAYNLKSEIFYFLNEDNENNLLIGLEEGGLYKLNMSQVADNTRPEDYVIKPVIGENGDNITPRSIQYLFKDKDKNMWVATHGAGVFMISAIKERFTKFQKRLEGEEGGSYLRFYGMCTDDEGNLWIGTDGDGIYKTKPTGELIKHYKADGRKGSLTGNAILYGFKDSKNNLWFGTYAHGLFLYNKSSDTFTNFQHNPKDKYSLGINDVRIIYEDVYQNIWIGTNGGGLGRMDPSTKKIQNFNRTNSDLGSNDVRAIVGDNNGNLFLGCYGAALMYYKASEKKFYKYFQQKKENELIPSGVILSLYLDKKGRLWIGTEGDGLVIYDIRRKTFKKYTDKNGLATTINAIKEQDSDIFWISTNKGLSKMDLAANKIYNYDASDGLQGGQFNPGSALYSEKGKFMCFGGTEGWNLFKPEDVKVSTVTAETVITGLQLFGKQIKVGKNDDNNNLLDKDISETDQIIFNPNQSVFTLQYAALNYSYPKDVEYAYKLEGLDKDWNYVKSQRSATYRYLPPNDYVFKVKASNQDGVWPEKFTSIKIRILPPWYKTWWAYLIWLSLTIGAMISFYKYRINLIKAQKDKLEKQVKERTLEVQRQAEELKAQSESLKSLNADLKNQSEELQTQSEHLIALNSDLEQRRAEEHILRQKAEMARKEADQANEAKSIFLATMSHEIRTPMNGVVGMASLLLETKLTPEQEEYANIINTSGDALLHVINDILDFSKIESGNLEIDQHEFDLRQCIESVLDIFATKAANQGLDLGYQLDSRLPEAIWGDSLRLRQILINFVSNAMKFTHKGEVFVEVNLAKSTDDLLDIQFEVRDTGIGIPEDKLGRLFKAFSQVDSSTTRKYGGTGLGLIISERLIKLMGGDVSVSSEVGVGTTFRFYIKAKAAENKESPVRIINSQITEGKKVLVIDENTSILKGLKTDLEGLKLKPVFAHSGQEALEIINTSEPLDLVILDMQMPDMDGISLAKAIKNINPKLPLLPLSYAGNEDVSKFPELFNSVLTKPIKHGQLLRLVQSALQDGSGVPATAEDSKRSHLLSEDFAASYPLKILIAEDNLINQKLATRVLNKLGYKPEIANDGKEAIEMFKDKPYDVILMDMQMPVMDGIEATKMIRSCEMIKQPQIIAMTANAMAEDRERCLKEGMNDYISKPVRLEELITILKNASITIKI